MESLTAHYQRQNETLTNAHAERRLSQKLSETAARMAMTAALSNMLSTSTIGLFGRLPTIIPKHAPTTVP
jgi:hypothetical protein